MTRIPDRISPDGFCVCGCGGRTTRMKYNFTRDGVVVIPAGSYRAFVQNHSSKVTNRPRSREQFIEMVMSKTKPGPNGCIEWTGYKVNGYGALKVAQKWQNAHRALWIAKFGPVPDRWHVDHICRNIACVNTDHLEPVPPGVNTLRGLAPSAINARKTHCHRGHEFTPENTYRAPSRPNSRSCIACRAFSTRAPRRKQAA